MSDQPIAIKKIVIEGVEHEVKVFAPSPVPHPNLSWPQSVRSEKAPIYAYYGNVEELVEYAQTKEDQR